MDNPKCPECGAGLVSKPISIMGIPKTVYAPCRCRVERKAHEEQRRIAQGRMALVERWKNEAGLKKRHRLQTFDSLLPDEGQRPAYEAALEIAENLPDAGLMLCGPVGCGKTHLAVSIINHIIENREISDRRALHEADGLLAQYREPSLQFVSTVDMLANIKKTYDSNADTQSVINRYAHARLLVLDDIGTEKPTEWANERLFEVIDHRYNELLPLVCTTNATPKELKERLGERCFDRLRAMCKMVAVKSKSHRVTA